ncbi:MAG TPA: hypothetical protein DER67_05620 [Novosphingobium sp.]|nr:hypothetical protein [Novosphingobium sp.]
MEVPMWGSTVLLPLLASGAAALPLPDHVDIPDGFSTTICPTEAAARTMLADYYRVKPAPNNHITDTERYFAGLKATGCAQDSPRTGTIIIKTVVARVELTLADGKESYIVYRGVMGSAATPVIGIVDEGNNNGFARTELASWKESHAIDGWLDARGMDQEIAIFYRCETPELARSVVASMKVMTKAQWQPYRAKLKQVAAAKGCRPARDRYYVAALLDQTYNDCGNECGIDLIAIEATERSGLKVGLVYDASEM